MRIDREACVSHQAVKVRAGIRVRGAAHAQQVNADHGRLRGWLQRVHGVASHHLPNYPGWWRWIRDAWRIRSPSPQALLTASLGHFPHWPVT